MTQLKVYKETDITNKEMIDVLQKLGFIEAKGDAHDYRMESKTADMYLLMPHRPLNEFILKGYTTKFSKMLLDFGVTEDFDDLVKMVLKERAKKRRAEKKQMAIMPA
jgi:hypothetical protein